MQHLEEQQEFHIAHLHPEQTLPAGAINVVNGLVPDTRCFKVLH